MGVPGKELPNWNRRGRWHHRSETLQGSLTKWARPYLACLEPERVVLKAAERIELGRPRKATKYSSEPPILWHGSIIPTYVRLNLVLSDALVDEIDDVLGRGAGKEDFSDAGSLKGGNVGLGDDAADEHGDVVHAFFVEELHQLRADGVVRTGEDGEADDVDVFLDSGGGDHLWGLAQAGVDDFHAGVAQSTGNYFCAGRGHRGPAWRSAHESSFAS